MKLVTTGSSQHIASSNILLTIIQALTLVADLRLMSRKSGMSRILNLNYSMTRTSTRFRTILIYLIFRTLDFCRTMSTVYIHILIAHARVTVIFILNVHTTSGLYNCTLAKGKCLIVSWKISWKVFGVATFESAKRISNWNRLLIKRTAKLFLSTIDFETFSNRKCQRFCKSRGLKTHHLVRLS